MGLADLSKQIDALIDGLIKLLYGVVTTALRVAWRPIQAGLFLSRISSAPVRFHIYLLAAVLIISVAAPSAEYTARQLVALSASTSQRFLVRAIDAVVVYVQLDCMPKVSPSRAGAHYAQRQLGGPQDRRWRWAAQVRRPGSEAHGREPLVSPAEGRGLFRLRSASP